MATGCAAAPETRIVEVKVPVPVYAEFPGPLLADCPVDEGEPATVRDLAGLAKSRGEALALCNRDKARLRELQRQHREALSAGP